MRKMRGMFRRKSEMRKMRSWRLRNRGEGRTGNSEGRTSP
jgi:hypothetical protein